jgi:hypothetical protein
MKLVFKSTNGLYGLLIKLVTRGKYTHCGVVINNIFYQASLFSGVTKSQYKPKNCHEIIMPLIKSKQAKIKNFLEKELNSGYDWLGILKFVFPFLKPSKNRWFCSELVAEALIEVGFLKKDPKPYYYSPKGLFDMVLKKLDKNIKTK